MGTEHDMVVNVWDWRNSVRLASNKMSFNVSAISFAKDGSYFVAAGNRLDWTLFFGRLRFRSKSWELQWMVLRVS